VESFFCENVKAKIASTEKVSDLKVFKTSWLIYTIFFADTQRQDI
jgi:hypothetical protein